MIQIICLALQRPSLARNAFRGFTSEDYTNSAGGNPKSPARRGLFGLTSGISKFFIGDESLTA
jgi:hypothetical protein